MVQKQFYVIFFFKKMQMQTSFDNGKPNFGWGKGGGWMKSLWGECFSKISKEMEFFILQVFMLNSMVDWAGCPAQSPIFKKLPL